MVPPRDTNCSWSRSKVFEIGTGSGYQSAYLSHLTNTVWTIEIIKPLAARTRGFYDALISKGYTEFKSITSKNADGYYGWADAGAALHGLSTADKLISR